MLFRTRGAGENLENWPVGTRSRLLLGGSSRWHGRGGRRWRARMMSRSSSSGGGEWTGVRKGPWTAEEDDVLRRHVMENGPRDWSSIRSKGLLPRTGKSCRLRWVNKLRPDLKKGCKFSAEEERVVIDLQAQFGNKWARIATYLTGRTDNDVKNFWSTRQKRLARLLRAPAPRRRPGIARQICGGASTSSHARESPTRKLLCQSPCMDMIPFQETKPHICQSSSGHDQVPRTVALAMALPMHYDDAADQFWPSSATPTATRLLLCGDAGIPSPSPASGVDPLVFVDPDDDEAFCPEPLAVVPPTPFFGLDEEYVHFGSAMHQGVRFDDLPPETLDFFALPPSGVGPTVG